MLISVVLGLFPFSFCTDEFGLMFGSLSVSRTIKVVMMKTGLLLNGTHCSLILVILTARSCDLHYMQHDQVRGINVTVKANYTSMELAATSSCFASGETIDITLASTDSNTKQFILLHVNRMLEHKRQRWKN